MNSNTSSAPIRTGRGFTLVELLVVIGIIGLLVAILLPALNAARKQALQIKCAAGMRQIGYAVNLYANANRGFLPPWRAGNVPATIGAAGGKYGLYNMIYGAPTSIAGVQTAEAAYWMDFIAPYLINGGTGGSGDVTKQQQDITNRSLIWGCPAWVGYNETNSAANAYGSTNRQRNGISYNYMPAFESGYPTPSTAGWPNTPEKDDIRSSTDFKTTVGADANTKPVWYKASRITHTTERAMCGDSSEWYLEARAWDGTGATPPQKLISYYDVAYARLDGANGAISPATTFDIYRHGTRPPVANNGPHGFYASSGGKVSYNILFFDGHVTSSNDRLDGYRVLRMRFPDVATK